MNSFTVHDRRWLTREEIAEIHEARARIAGEEFTRLLVTGDLADDEVIEGEYKMHDTVWAANQAAAGIRATEKLSNPMGSRS